MHALKPALTGLRAALSCNRATTHSTLLLLSPPHSSGCCLQHRHSSDDVRREALGMGPTAFGDVPAAKLTNDAQMVPSRAGAGLQVCLQFRSDT